MKKKFLSFVLAICFMIPCVFMLAGCGAADCLVWENTFKYQGEMRYQADSWDRDAHPYKKVEEFLNSKVDDINWADCSIDYSSKGWTTGREIIDGLQAEIDNYYKTATSMETFEITFSSEEEAAVTFKNTNKEQTFYIKENPDMPGFLDAYSISEGQAGHEESRVMSFREKCSESNFEVTFSYTNDIQFTQSFTFAFSTPYTKYSGEQSSYWTVDFVAYFGRVENN